MKRAGSILVLSSIASTGLFFAKAQSQELGYYHPNYLAVKVEKVDKEGYVTLSGNFRKNSPGDCSTVKLVFDLYGSRDRLLGRATAWTSDLEAYTNWNFEALSTVEPRGYSKYKLLAKICEP